MCVWKGDRILPVTQEAITYCSEYERGDLGRSHVASCEVHLVCRSRCSGSSPKAEDAMRYTRKVSAVLKVLHGQAWCGLRISAVHAGAFVANTQQRCERVIGRTN